MKALSFKKFTVEKSLPYILLIVGFIGLVASFALTYDKIQVLQNGDYRPSCNINPILSCSSVMKTEQASLFGVPNTVFGLIAFTSLLTFAALLASGVKVKRWIWVVAQIAASAGVVFMHYLFFQGVFRINAICPWCFATWMITIPAFLYISVYNLRLKNLRFNGRFTAVSEFIQRHHIDILITWYLLIFAVLLQHFWDYWSTLL